LTTHRTEQPQMGKKESLKGEYRFRGRKEKRQDEDDLEQEDLGKL